MSEVVNDPWERITLITKPEQSGKTFLMIQQIIKDCEETLEGKKTINFIYCSNSLLLTKQTGARVGSDEGLIEVQGEKYVRFSSADDKDSVKTIESVICKILINGVHNIVCCTNKRRVEDVPSIIRDLNSAESLNDQFQFKIWLDEADTATTAISKEFVPLLTEQRNVELNLLTATPEKLFNKFNRINVLPLENTTLPTYHGWEDNQRYIMEENTHDTVGFAQGILNNLISANNGTKWFIPADHKKSSHREMRDMLKGKDFAVFIVNGDGIELTIPGKRGTITESKTDELNIQLKRMYEEHSLNQFPIAITGHFCITRGITIASEDFLIDGAILSNCQNKQEVSQTAGRVKGNWKDWGNYKVPIVFTTQKFNRIAIEKEQQSRNLARMAKEQEQRGDGTEMDRGALRMSGRYNMNIEHELFDTFESANEFVKTHILTATGKRGRINKPQRDGEGFVKKSRKTFEQVRTSIMSSESWTVKGASAKKAFAYYEDTTKATSEKWVVFFQRNSEYFV